MQIWGHVRGSEPHANIFSLNYYYIYRDVPEAMCHIHSTLMVTPDDHDLINYLGYLC